MNKFVVIVTTYNGEKYIDRCLASIVNQDYDNFEVVVIDDCSTDKTWNRMLRYPVKRIRNIKRQGSALANIVSGVKHAKRDDIIVIVDGDDYLSDDSVLSYLDTIYSKDVWMTYGQYTPESRLYKNFCKPIDPIGYRKSGKWVTTHLKTFRKWLWTKIDDEDLRINGEYSVGAGDRAFMYPMIEMSGNHIRYVEKVLYIYNDYNETNLFKLCPSRCDNEAEYFINLPEYKEL
jgi:glycosyltransferase involved in cell wall biosynthesis